MGAGGRKTGLAVGGDGGLRVDGKAARTGQGKAKTRKGKGKGKTGRKVGKRASVYHVIHGPLPVPPLWPADRVPLPLPLPAFSRIPGIRGALPGFFDPRVRNPLTHY